MKEKLIEWMDGWGFHECDRDKQEKLATDLISKLRCDRCKHWDHFEESVPVGSCDEVDRLTRPDFFCARWEDKTSV